MKPVVFRTFAGTAIISIVAFAFVGMGVVPASADPAPVYILGYNVFFGQNEAMGNGLAFSSDGSTVYTDAANDIVNPATNSVYATDLATRAVTTITDPSINDPQGLAVSHDGSKLYVGDGSILVVDTASNTVAGTIPNPGGSAIALAISPNGSKMYVLNTYSNTMSVIDTATDTVTATITSGTFNRPSAVAFTPDGAHAYVTNSGSNYDGTTVTVIDTATDSVDPVTPTITVGTNPEGVAVTPDGSKVYVASGVSTTVSVIATASNTVTATISTGTSGFDAGVAVSPDGSKVLVTTSDYVDVIDTATDSLDPNTPPLFVLESYEVAFNPVPTAPVAAVATGSFNWLTTIGAPVGLTTTALPGGSVGVPYSSLVPITGTSPLSITDPYDTLPPGLSLDPATRVISGTPTVAGLTYVGLGVGNSLTYTVTYVPIVITGPPAIISAPPPDGTVGSDYSFQVIATGYPTPAFSVTRGSLPAGLSLDPNSGVISGTPTNAGSSSFTISATNALGTDSEPYTVTVNSPPEITSPAPVDGTVGGAYSFQVTATGTGPISYTVTAGTLPAGLSLDPLTGVIYGMPTTAAASSFTIAATNTLGADVEAYAVVIAATSADPPTAHLPIVSG